VVLSMTGFGEAHVETDGLRVSVEVRAVNHRFLKTAVRVTEGYTAFVPLVEGVLRQRMRRGTVHAQVRIALTQLVHRFRIDERMLECYWRQLEDLRNRWQLAEPVPLATLLSLPGVVVAETQPELSESDCWPVVEKALRQALDEMDRMRAEEGRAMLVSAKSICDQALRIVEQVQARMPAMLEAYRLRLHERLTALLAERQMMLEPGDLLREVALLAERSDIEEEVTRLRSHFDQFVRLLDSEQCTGRRLEFLTQEMHREVNTIGAKVSDLAVAQMVVDLKTCVERLREMVQNIE